MQDLERDLHCCLELYVDQDMLYIRHVTNQNFLRLWYLEGNCEVP